MKDFSPEFKKHFFSEEDKNKIMKDTITKFLKDKKHLEMKIEGDICEFKNKYQDMIKDIRIEIDYHNLTSGRILITRVDLKIIS